MRRWVFWTPSLPRLSVGGSNVCNSLILFASLVVLAFLIDAPTSAEDKITAKITVPDALTVPDRSVRLEAQVSREHLLAERGVGGEQIEFLVGGKKIGATMTGGDGRGFLDYTPRMRGNLPLGVRLVESARVAFAEGSGTLFSWERRRPIVLVEMEALKEEAKAPLVPFSSLAGDTTLSLPSTPMPDAVDELKRLTDFYYNIMYVMRGPASHSDDTRQWLREHRFPVGPLLITDKAEGLAQKIEDFRRNGWDNVKVGIGRSKEFADALIGQRIDVVIVPATDRGTLPKKAQLASTWKEVRKKKL